MIRVSQRSPPRVSQLANAAGFSACGPTVMDVNHERSARSSDSRHVRQEAATICGSLNHAQRAEQADCVIGRVGCQTPQVDQVRLDGTDSPVGRVVAACFLQHRFQHRAAEIDANHVISTRRKRHRRAARPAAQVQDNGRSRFRRRKILSDDLLIQITQRSIRHKSVIMGGDRPLVGVFPGSRSDAARPAPIRRSQRLRGLVQSCLAFL